MQGANPCLHKIFRNGEMVSHNALDVVFLVRIQVPKPVLFGANLILVSSFVDRNDKTFNKLVNSMQNITEQMRVLCCLGKLIDGDYVLHSVYAKEQKIWSYEVKYLEE